MAESFLDQIRQRFPRAEDLAFQRIFARGHTIFFDTKRRRLLPGFTESEVFAILILAKTYVNEAGAELELTADEKKIFRGYVVPTGKRQ